MTVTLGYLCQLSLWHNYSYVVVGMAFTVLLCNAELLKEIPLCVTEPLSVLIWGDVWYPASRD
jgi:hypothetical protein